MIRRLGIGCVLVAALAMPAGAAAKSSPGEVKNAAKHCKALRAEMGRDAFREEFGANKNRRNAFGKCVAKHARGEHRAAKRALRACKAEYAAGPVAFLEKYGSDESAEASFERPGEALRSAMHKCVRLTLKALRTERREALESAVEECKTELVADPAAFMEKYGPGASAETSGEEPGAEPGAGHGDHADELPKLDKLIAFGRCVLSKVNAARNS